MNNKEKREYINCLTLVDQPCSLSEIAKRNEVLKKSPNVLYKYRPFDRFTFEMIRKNYAYLSPVKDLDDPFDCVSDFSLSKLFNIKSNTISNLFIDYVIKTSGIKSKEQIKEINKNIKKCMSNKGLDVEKTAKELQRQGFPADKSKEYASFLVDLQNSIETYADEGGFRDFAKAAYNPDEIIGVCSLSEIRDNKVMWSLYGKKYSGYCVEYEIPFTKEARKTLYPVLYSRKISYNFTLRMYDSIQAEFKRMMKNESLIIDETIENVGAIYELFCLKDTDWKYQQEWRILGRANYHFPYLKIKAIYLGFKVAPTNEKKMKTYAKRYGFDLYKMNAPCGKKKITYFKI